MHSSLFHNTYSCHFIIEGDEVGQTNINQSFYNWTNDNICLTNTVDFYDEMTDYMNDGTVMDILDFFKVCDTTFFNILICKLRNYGLDE